MKYKPSKQIIQFIERHNHTPAMIKQAQECCKNEQEFLYFLYCPRVEQLLPPKQFMEEIDRIFANFQSLT